ncbi:unnamed protein product, partial [Dicrocoelium dendriticum]
VSSSVEGKNRSSLSPDEIEEALVLLLHKNYIEFAKKLCSGSTTPHKIKEQAFRNIVSDTIGFTTKEDQWNQFKRHIPYAEPQVIDYEQFLTLFNYP